MRFPSILGGILVKGEQLQRKEDLLNPRNCTNPGIDLTIHRFIIEMNANYYFTVSFRGPEQQSTCAVGTSIMTDYTTSPAFVTVTSPKLNDKRIN